MQLSIIVLGSFLAIILVCNSYGADLAKDHPLKRCGLALSEGNLQDCVSEVVNRFHEHQDWSNAKRLTHCGTVCQYEQKGRFLGWEWVWDTRIRCESKAPGIVGEATKKSRNGAKHWALVDLYTKAKPTGRFSAEDMECWEKKKNN
ncbi:unnamed protein product [Adineta steineri]|uniref:Uncharacterized protein n=1 Tax=Adineta steineri TaxID=433720 RepID=A0A815AGE6_9BILA|nr:unnamed protein product [Adineta steineri]CAF1254291.1 unnamed protein product [Adineta steineri]